MKLFTSKGHRIKKKTLMEIKIWAAIFVKLLGINKSSSKNMANFMDWGLQTQMKEGFPSNTVSNVTIVPIDDESWMLNPTYFLSYGFYDSAKNEIALPESLYLRACEGCNDAIKVVMHEIAHCFLGHKVLLRWSTEGNESRRPEEDSEWQADCFANFVLEKMGILPINAMTQLSFDFKE